MADEVARMEQRSLRGLLRGELHSRRPWNPFPSKSGTRPPSAVSLLRRTGVSRPSEVRGSVLRSQKLRAFTLVEVLAALAFMAIVVPVAVQGLQIANRAGQVGQRKTAAARIADRVMSELLVTGQLRGGSASGVVQEGPQRYQWLLLSEISPVSTLRLVTVKVTFPVQGQDYDVRLSTLVDPTL